MFKILYFLRPVIQHTLLFLLLLFLPEYSKAQRFVSTSGDFTRAMHIHPVEAAINGINLSAGDEIGIFDGELCVGMVVLTADLGELTDTKAAHVSAGMDDQITSGTDGFIPGNSISFRVWDNSEGREIADAEAVFYNKAGELIPAPVFETGQTVFVSLKATYNTAPVADAGNDRTVDENSLVQMDGSGSSDNEGQSLSYTWKDVDNIGLSSLNDVKPYFTAPEVSDNFAYRLVLTVSDGELDSEPDTVVVTVKNVPKPPVADAGADVTIEEEETGRLNGSGSSDPEGLNLTYSWEIIPADIIPDSPQSASTYFIAPEVTQDEKYFAILTVTNSAALSDKDTAVITVTNRVEPPVADAGPDIEVQEGSGNYQLDGSGSHDPQNRILTYNWNDPDGLRLNKTDSAFPSFNSPEVLQDKDYRVILTVDNGVYISEPDTIVVTVTANRLPVIITELNVEADESSEVVLDASASHDPDNDELTFRWSVLFDSQKDMVAFNNTSSPAPTVTVSEVNEDKTLRITLEVSDGKDSEAIIVELHINNINKAPVADAGLDFFMGERSTTELDGMGSFDEDGDALSFYWYSDELTIGDATSATPVITAPEVEEEKTVLVVLTVNDGNYNSEPDTVRVTIENINRPPVADAGSGGEVEEGEIFTLDGSGSFDPDGDALIFHWNLPELLKGSIQSAALSTTAPQVEKDTVFPVVLTVSDGEATSLPDTAFITVKQKNQSPQFAPVPDGIAHAGYSFSAEVSVTDPDVLDEVVIFSDDLPDWLSLIDNGNRKALLTADPVPRDEDLLGTHSFVLKAFDGLETVELTVIFTITVQTGPEDFRLGKVDVYPNPVSGILFVDFDHQPERETMLHLYNSEGKRVLTHRAARQNLQLSLRENPAGIYYLKINSQRYSLTKKIILRNN